MLLKQSFAFFPPFRIGVYISIRKIKAAYSVYHIHWIALSFLSYVSILYLFLLPNSSNLHAPTLECVNPARLDPNRCHPNMWLRQTCRWILRIRRSGYARCGYICFDPIALETEAGRSLWVRGQSSLQSKLWDSQGCYTEEPVLSPPTQEKNVMLIGRISKAAPRENT